MLTFSPLTRQHPGLLFSLLSQTYEEYSRSDPDRREEWYKDWREYDRDVFKHPNTMARCGFVSHYGSRIVGFASWDPRQFPTTGIIGHIVILPEFQDSGFGRTQINRILNIFKDNNVKKAEVTTGDHPFYAPAQKMYVSCGFALTINKKSDHSAGLATLRYELNL